MRFPTEEVVLPCAVSTDRRGRRFRKLRVSVTDACNLRCLYCGGDALRPRVRSEALRAPDILAICRILCGLGVDEIRLTGGEPTMRPDLNDIVAGLSDLSPRKLGITSNGIRLKPLLPFMATTACRHINISLDSLRADRFRSITGSGAFYDVLDAIIQAAGSGFHVKLNMVMMKGLNDDEVFDYIDFSARHRIEVRFLELMRIGYQHANQPDLFFPAQEVIDRIRMRMRLFPEMRERDSTSFNYQTESGARIGFIASESRSFCGNCSRLRLSSRGTLRACLMDDHETDVRGLPSDEYPRVLRELLGKKPLCGMERTRQSMCSIGG